MKLLLWTFLIKMIRKRLAQFRLDLSVSPIFTFIQFHLGGKQEASFIDVKGCFARDNFKEIMTTALNTCERIHGQFVSMVAEEVKETFKGKDSAIEEDLGLGKLRIFEAGEEQFINCLNIAEYDQAFEQIISSSESEEEDI
jgi:hypothetical protein